MAPSSAASLCLGIGNKRCCQPSYSRNVRMEMVFEVKIGRLLPGRKAASAPQLLGGQSLKRSLGFQKFLPVKNNSNTKAYQSGSARAAGGSFINPPQHHPSADRYLGAIGTGQEYCDRIAGVIRREVLITYQVTRSNGVLAAFPGLVLGPVAAFVSRRAVNVTLLRDLALAAIWPLLYLYTFEACNQLTGLEEDRVNKPFRPLVTGLLTVPGLRARRLVANALMVAVLWPFGVAHYGAAQIALNYAYHHKGLSNHGVAKSLWNAPAAGLIMGAVWRLGSGKPLTAPVWTWIANLCAVCAILVTQQDLKDVDGDVIKGRKTVPVVLGEGPARRLLAAAYAAAPFLYHATMLAGIPGAARFVLAAPVFAVLWCIAYRTLAARSRRADVVTFQMFSWWCLYMMVLPLFIWPRGL